MPKRFSEKERHLMPEAEKSAEDHEAQGMLGEKSPDKTTEVYIPDYVMYDFGSPEKTDGGE